MNWWRRSISSPGRRCPYEIRAGSRSIRLRLDLDNDAVLKKFRQLNAGPKVKVVRIGEEDLRANPFELRVRQRLDGALRADRHEHGRLHDAVRRAERAAARGAIGAEQGEAE